MGTATVWRLAINCGLIGWIAVACTAGSGRTLSTAELLLDLARDHGLNCRGQQTTADVQHIRTLLRAAVRLDPRLSDAYMWLHELAVLCEDQQEAVETVRRLVAADPAHQGAFARWLEVGLEANQTVEKRAEWLTGMLDTSAARPELQAMVYVQLSRLALTRLDRDAAGQYANQALALDPVNPDAAALQLELLNENAEPHVRLAAALLFLQLSPYHVDTAWQVGVLLDQHGFSEQAQTFYEHALEIHRRVEPHARPPATHLLQLARHALTLEQFEAAGQYVREAIAADPGVAAEAGILLHWLYAHQGWEAQADEVRAQLAKRFANLRQPNEWPVNEVAQAAWFYCTLDEQPQRALMLAEAAAARAPQDVFVMRVLGWAQLANLQIAEAVQTLLPIAADDPYAAYHLARLAQGNGNAAGAERIMRGLKLPPGSGPAHELLAGLGLPPAATQPSASYPAIAHTLAAFNQDVLAFHRAPDRFLDAAVNVEDRSPAPGEPWRLECTLTNRASFPITLGPEWMVNPVFLLSFEMEGDRQRQYPHLLTITLDRLRVIPPGATVKIRRTIDVGPLRRVSRRTPQQAQRVTVRALLDPVRGPDGQWQPGLGGQTLPPVYFNRLPAGTSREALHVLFHALTADSDAARFRAVEVLAQLLSEKQRHDLGRLNYRPEPIPAQRVQQALLASLSSESWELRSRTLDTLQIVGFDAAMLRAVESCLEHPHWLVRLMAVRLLGARQGKACRSKLQPLADSDPDELVRALAGAYIASWESAAPATQPVEGSGRR